MGHLPDVANEMDFMANLHKWSESTGRKLEPCTTDG